VPFTVMRESADFMFNRIWHATRRKMPDGRPRGHINPRGGRPHLAALDRHGVRTVPAHGPDRPRRRARRREHYATIRDRIPTAPPDLLRGYASKGFPGAKSGRGFYDDYRD
jgi:3-hydroxybutyryl-CoA dehydrogenase